MWVPALGSVPVLVVGGSIGDRAVQRYPSSEFCVRGCQVVVDRARRRRRFLLPFTRGQHRTKFGVLFLPFGSWSYSRPVQHRPVGFSRPFLGESARLPRPLFPARRFLQGQAMSYSGCPPLALFWAAVRCSTPRCCWLPPPAAPSGFGLAPSRGKSFARAGKGLDLESEHLALIRQGRTIPSAPRFVLPSQLFPLKVATGLIRRWVRTLGSAVRHPFARQPPRSFFEDHFLRGGQPGQTVVLGRVLRGLGHGAGRGVDLGHGFGGVRNQLRGSGWNGMVRVGGGVGGHCI